MNVTRIAALCVLSFSLVSSADKPGKKGAAKPAAEAAPAAAPAPGLAGQPVKRRGVGRGP